MALGDSLSAALVARDDPPDDSHFSTPTAQSLKGAVSGAGNVGQTPYVAAANAKPHVRYPGQWEEYRGLAYPIGVDPGAVTLASILSHFTPQPLLGGSTGHHPPLACASEACGRGDEDGLNAAVSGSVAAGLKAQVTGECGLGAGVMAVT